MSEPLRYLFPPPERRRVLGPFAAGQLATLGAVAMVSVFGVIRTSPTPRGLMAGMALLGLTAAAVVVPVRGRSGQAEKRHARHQPTRGGAGPNDPEDGDHRHRAEGGELAGSERTEHAPALRWWEQIAQRLAHHWPLRSRLDPRCRVEPPRWVVEPGGAAPGPRCEPLGRPPVCPCAARATCAAVACAAVRTCCATTAGDPGQPPAVAVAARPAECVSRVR